MIQGSITLPHHTRLKHVFSCNTAFAADRRFSSDHSLNGMTAPFSYYLRRQVVGSSPTGHVCCEQPRHTYSHISIFQNTIHPYVDVIDHLSRYLTTNVSTSPPKALVNIVHPCMSVTYFGPSVQGCAVNKMTIYVAIDFIVVKD